MDEQRFRELWTQLLDQQPVSTADQLQFRRQLENDPDVGAAFDRDVQLDAVLRTMASHAGHDAFVDELNRRLDDEMGIDDYFDEAVDGSMEDEVEPAVENAEGPPPVPPPVINHARVAPVVLPTARIAPDQKTTSQNKFDNGREFGNERTWIVALASIAALLAFIVLGVMLNRPSRVVEQPRDSGANTTELNDPPSAVPSDQRQPVDSQPQDDGVDATPRPDGFSKPETSSPELVQFGPSTEATPSDNETIEPAPAPARPIAMVPIESTPIEVAPIDQSASPTPTRSGGVVATLIDAPRAIWSSDSVITSQLERCHLRLVEGEASLRMASGSVIKMQAPCELTLDDPNAVSLLRGRLVSKVPAQATGFLVLTPSSRVVDLGTEFVVDVEDDGATAVRVVQGAVNMSPIEDDDGQSWRLEQGDFKWLSADRGSAVDWKLNIRLDESGSSGTLTLNGQTREFAQPHEFSSAYRMILSEFSQIASRVARTRNTDEVFQGEVSINGERRTFDDYSDYQRVKRDTIRTFRDLWTQSMRNGRGVGAFNGSINVNGVEIPFGDLSGLLDAQQEMIKRFGEGFGNDRAGNDQAGNDRADKDRADKDRADGEGTEGAIRVNGSEIKIQNLQDLLKAQEEMLKRFGAGNLVEPQDRTNRGSNRPATRRPQGADARDGNSRTPLAPWPFGPPQDQPQLSGPLGELQTFGAPQLTEQLEKLVREVGIYRTQKEAAAMFRTIRGVRQAAEQSKESVRQGYNLASQVSGRADLRGLPYQQGNACRLEGNEFAAMRELAQNPVVQSQRRRAMKDERIPEWATALAVHRGFEVDRVITGRNFRKADYVPGLVQMFEADREPMRLGLVQTLASVASPTAQRALAERAVFDLSPRVRHAATTALAERDPATFRDVFIQALRYPWIPVAQHAAESLVALDDDAAATKLVELLDEPDPRLPFKHEQGGWAVREVVKLNHMRNCTLCHSVSLSSSDSLTGVIPEPNKELPPAYYNAPDGDYVRADETYLRQDFSVTHQVPESSPWPARQRYDYLVRTRPATPLEREAAKMHAPNDSAHRQAVLYALRQLTDEDHGNSAEDWRAAVTAPKTEPDVDPPGDP